MRRVVLTVLALALVAPVGPARAATYTVLVRSNFYEPKLIEVQPGDTVEWLAIDEGHTVTSKAGLWDSGMLAPGATFSRTFTEPGVYNYACAVHGTSMSGTVVVPGGDGGTVLTVPSAETPTLRAALDQAAPGSEIRVLPGRYELSVALAVNATGIRIVGWDDTLDAPARPDQVVVANRAGAPHAFEVAGSDVRVANMTIEGFRYGAILLARATRYAVEHVVARGNEDYGIFVDRATGGRIADVVVEGGERAGVLVRGCGACGLLVDRVVVERAFHGFDADRAAGLVVRDSTFRANANGIVLRSGARADGMPQAGAEIVGNVIEDAGAPDAAHTADFARALERGDVGAGAGIWVAGGSWNVIRDNDVAGGLYGIAVTVFASPSNANRIVGNRIEDAARAAIAWDGVGAATCFGGNRTGAQAASSEPPLLEQTASCDLPAQVGVPSPRILPDLVGHARGTYWPA